MLCRTSTPHAKWGLWHVNAHEERKMYQYPGASLGDSLRGEFGHERGAIDYVPHTESLIQISPILG